MQVKVRSMMARSHHIANSNSRQRLNAQWLKICDLRFAIRSHRKIVIKAKQGCDKLMYDIQSGIASQTTPPSFIYPKHL